MMTTRFDGGMRARSMEARPDKDEGVIWFLTDHRGLKDNEIDATAEVCLKREKVISPSPARASVAHDPDRAAALWNGSGPDDPNLRVVRVEPSNLTAAPPRKRTSPALLCPTSSPGFT